MDIFLQALRTQGSSSPAQINSLSKEDLIELGLEIMGDINDFLEHAKLLPNVTSWTKLAPTVTPEGTLYNMK